ncbi:MAG: 30S ribosomal protein S7 [Bacteroidota bacterium]
MRKKRAKKRTLLPDLQYQDPLVTRFINNMMVQGKKNLAASLFYGALRMVGEKTGEGGLTVWRKALQNATPAVEVKRRRVGGTTLQVPIEIRGDRRTYLAIKWLITQARSRPEKTTKERLVNEIIAASQGEGKAVKKKTETHKMAESNRAFSHLRF